MKISNELELIDLAIFTNRTLIMSDFHIGYEEALNKQGLMVPRFQFQEIMKRLENIFLRLKGRKIERIIVCGDLKHEFGSISDQEWRQTLKLLDYFGQYCNEIILIKGNHDTILGPIAKKRNVRVVEHYIIEPTTNHNTNKTIKKNTILKNSINNINKKVQKNIKNDTIKKITINSIAANKINIINKKNQNYDKKETFKKITMKNKLFKKISVAAKCKKNHKNKILFLHGDKLPEKKLLKDVSTIIIGHEHPAVTIKDGPRTELFKAFLIGKWKGKDLIVMPSFNLITEGTDVLKEEVLSPFLNNLDNFKAIVVSDKLYKFGKLKDF